MITSEPVAHLSGAVPSRVAQTLMPDAWFDARWAAWVMRGRLHDQRVHRRFVIVASVVAIGAAIAFAFVR